MTYKIEIRRQAQRALDRLPDNDYRKVLDAITDLANSPRPRGVEKVKGSVYWRVRQGDYRIIYDINDKQRLITIVRVGHRREIYRIF